MGDKSNVCTACTAAANAATTTWGSATGTDSVAATCNDGFWKDGTACKACTAADPVVANAMYTCGSVNAPTSFTKCEDGFFKDGDKCTACQTVANSNSVKCSDATTITSGACNTGFQSNPVDQSDGTKACIACDAIANAAVTCTYPGNSILASCNANFELKSGACTAVVVPDAPATTPAATPVVATPSSGKAGLSAANTATIGFAAAVVAAVASVASL